MEHTQLELDFTAAHEGGERRAEVLDFQRFAAQKQARRDAVRKAELVAEIVKSVQHIPGRSPDAEMM